ncbi:hypothetical protein AALP_AA6G279400 [Arabis alpina]|uniref:Uncharacterized protein n=1 Tax=Arabis alpina TaxID=50452 RepID=A0A087GS64_ARAAL|nr:hypothetical protein AALP_AA6G279400 [Arabis alpina]
MELCLSLSPSGEEDDDEDDVFQCYSTQQRLTPPPPPPPPPPPILLHHLSLRPPPLRPNPYRLHQRLNRRSKSAPLGSEICEISDEINLSPVCVRDTLVSLVQAMANLDLNLKIPAPFIDGELVLPRVLFSFLSPFPSSKKKPRRAYGVFKPSYSLDGPNFRTTRPATMARSGGGGSVVNDGSSGASRSTRW